VPRLLTDLPDASLWRGDIIRLAHNYDTGYGTGPVDLMVYDPYEEGRGLGVIVASGYKAGNVLSIFPEASLGAGKRSLETAWLLANWSDWFCFTYENDGDKPRPVPVEGTLILDWSEREIVVKA